MNQSGRNSSSSSSRGRVRGRGQQLWQKVPTDSSSSSDFQTPVRADASSTGRTSDSMDRKPHSTWQAKGHNSESVVSQKYENATPANHHRQQQGNSAFGAESSPDSKSQGSGKIKGHNSDGVIVRNKANVAPVGRHNQQQDHSVYRDESNFRGGKAKQWTASSKAINTANLGDADDKQLGVSSVEAKVSISPDSCVMESVDHLADVSRLSLESSVETSRPDTGDVALKSSDKGCDHKDNEHSDCSTQVKAFDICPPKSGSTFTLKPSLFTRNREKRNEMNKSIDGPKGLILRPGMVLLKNYLSSSEQANILKICRTHGLGSAGFYQPGYREGGELHLKMMCFGEFWDPETSKYWKVRPKDQAKPPSVPSEFLMLVKRAMKFAHSLIREDSKVKNVEEVLPPVNPDICIVNYYSKTGRLGLHQDKDESPETLAKGIPIVSFSIGDSADFLYGDQRDPPDNAKKIVLDSGDVLIFGGKSRHIFHGVSAIKPDSAPKSLLESTNFRPGRLNLTFRQHL